MTETREIRETVLNSIQEVLFNTIIETDSYIVIQVITDDLKAPNQICNN